MLQTTRTVRTEIGMAAATGEIVPASRDTPIDKPRRIFLLSPANANGVRARMILSDRAKFNLAVRLRNGGLPLGELFSFISGLYFRGKLAYAQVFGNSD